MAEAMALHAGARGRVRLGRWVAACLAISAVLLGLLMRAAGLSIDPLSPGDLPYYLAGSVALALYVGLNNTGSRRARVVRDIAEYYALFMLTGLLGAVAAYPAAAETRGFVDPVLARMDAAAGFDWVALYRVVAAHPVLQLAGRAAYFTIYVTPAFILGAFAIDGRRDRAERMLATFWLAALLTLIAFAFMPAIGPLGYLWHGPVPYMPASALWQPELIPLLREHGMRHVDLGLLRGLVSAPSFHTTAALLYIVCAWPVRRLRWPVLAVNIAMLLSTPIEGTHYLTDMIGGALVAAAAWSIVRLTVPSHGGGEARPSRTGTTVTTL